MRVVMLCCLLTCCATQHGLHESHSKGDVQGNGSFVADKKRSTDILEDFEEPPKHPSSSIPKTLLDMNPLLKMLTTTYLGYELVDGWMGRYKLHTDVKNWTDAQRVCAQESANLLVINSRDEAEAMRFLMEKTGTAAKYYWIGFHDVYEEGNYVTIHRYSLASTGYAVWGYSEPDATSDQNCGVFGKFPTNEFGLGDFFCSANLPYICELETVAGLISIPTQHSRAPDGYELIPSIGYYKFHQYEATWQQAVDTCAREGGHLIILNSEQEANDLKLPVRGQNVIWTGVHDQYQEGNYITIFNVTLQSTGFFKWGPGEPDGAINSNCLGLSYDDNRVQGLHDASCTESRHFVCEYEV